MPTAFHTVRRAGAGDPVEHLQMPAPLVLSVCRLDRVPYPATGVTCAGAPDYRRPDPTGRRLGGRGPARCDVWLPPKRIALGDGSSALLPVLVIVAATRGTSPAG